MAKSSQKSVNPRSRAAKRATSPGIDVDRSIKEMPRATDATPVLGVTRAGGISKKRKKAKSLTRGQRVRQEKGLSRAEAVMDQLVKKVDIAKSRQAKIDQRRGVWEDINEESKQSLHQAVAVTGHTSSGRRSKASNEVNGGDTEEASKVPLLDPAIDHKTSLESPSVMIEEIDLIS